MPKTTPTRATLTHALHVKAGFLHRGHTGTITSARVTNALWLPDGFRNPIVVRLSSLYVPDYEILQP